MAEAYARSNLSERSKQHQNRKTPSSQLLNSPNVQKFIQTRNKDSLKVFFVSWYERVQNYYTVNIRVTVFRHSSHGLPRKTSTRKTSILMFLAPLAEVTP